MNLDVGNIWSEPFTPNITFFGDLEFLYRFLTLPKPSGKYTSKLGKVLELSLNHIKIIP